MELKKNNLNDSVTRQNNSNAKPETSKIFLKILIFIAVTAFFILLSKFYRNLIIWVVNAIFFGFGIWCFIGYPKQFRLKRLKLTQTVSAILSEVKEIVHSDKNGDWHTYFATYEFKFNGSNYKVQSKEEYDEKPQKGIDTKLLIDPDKPNEIYEVEREKTHIKVMKFVGVFFIVCGFFMLMNNFV